MANIPIKHINSGDTVSTAFDIVNYNFDLLLLNGGGPRGIQGTQGQQGNRGIQGLQGLQGSKGASVYTSIEEAQANNGIYFDTQNLYTIDYSGGGGGSEEQHVSEETASLNPFVLQDNVIRTNTASAVDKPLVLGLGEKRLTDGAVENVNSSLNVVCGVPSDSGLQYGSMSFLHCQYHEEDPNALEISGKSIVRGDGNGGLHIEPAGEIRIHGSNDNRSGVVLEGLYNVQNGSLLNVGNTGIVGSADWAAVGNTFFPTSGPGVIGGDSVGNMIGRIKMHNTTYNSLTGNNGIIESPNGIALSVGNGSTLHSFNYGLGCVCLYDGNKHPYSLKSLDAPALFIRNRERNISSIPSKDGSLENITNPHCATITVSSEGGTNHFKTGLLQVRGQIVYKLVRQMESTSPIDNNESVYRGMNCDVFLGGGDHFAENRMSSYGTTPGNGGTAYVSGGVSARSYNPGSGSMINDTKSYTKNYGDVKIGINPLLHYGEGLPYAESSTYETRDVDICANRIVSVNADLRDVDNSLGELDPKKSIGMQVNTNLTVTNSGNVYEPGSDNKKYKTYYSLDDAVAKYRSTPVLVDDLSECSVMSGVMLNATGVGAGSNYRCRWIRVGNIVTATYYRINHEGDVWAYLPVMYVALKERKLLGLGNIVTATAIPNEGIFSNRNTIDISSYIPDGSNVATITYDLSYVKDFDMITSDGHSLGWVCLQATGSGVYSANIRNIFQGIDPEISPFDFRELP